jgi:hypothetical protein
LVLTQKFKTTIHDITRYVFVEKYDPQNKLVLHEGQGMAWYKHDDIDKLKIDEQDVAALEFVYKKI